MCMSTLLSFRSQQVKWNHFIMTSVLYVYIYMSLWTYIHALFHRDETKPTHIIGINSFLFFMQLFYKHASPNYQHMINSRKLINKMLVSLRVCTSWNIFNRIHFFAICDVLEICAIRSCVECEISIYDDMSSWRSSFDKLFFSSYTIHFTLLVNCSNTIILAEQSLHHNIILEKLDHCWVNRICTKIVISESRTMSLLHI